MKTEQISRPLVRTLPQVVIATDGDSQIAVYRNGVKIIEDSRDNVTAARVLKALGVPVKQVDLSAADLIGCGNCFPERLDELRGQEQEKLSVGCGTTIVLAGTFPQSHSKISRFLQALGASVRDDVSNRTDFLVAGKNPGEQTLAKARELGVVCVEAEDFWRMIDARPAE